VVGRKGTERGELESERSRAETGEEWSLGELGRWKQRQMGVDGAAAAVPVCPVPYLWIERREAATTRCGLRKIIRCFNSSIQW
jgi:hypothetical protein